MPTETWSVSTGTVDFVVGVDKKLWVGSGLFKNCKSFFSTQGSVFGSKSFDYTDWIALPDDAANTTMGTHWSVTMTRRRFNSW